MNQSTYCGVLRLACLLGCLPVLSESMAHAQENLAAPEPKPASKWMDMDNRVTALITKHTDERGHAHPSLVFLLLDENRRGLAIAVPDSHSLRIYFRRKLELELEQRLRDYELDQYQVEKLMLAADLDITRLMRKAQIVDQQLATLNYETGMDTANRLIGPLKIICDFGPFTEDSLFGQVWSTIAPKGIASVH